MAAQTYPNKPQIVYSCVSKRTVEAEIFIRQHIIDYLISGSSEAFFAGEQHAFKAGDFRFAVKNRLSKFVKEPPQGGEYRSVSICIDNDTLLELKDQFKKQAVNSAMHGNVFLLKPNHVFKNYIDSLLPYLEHSEYMTEELVKAKVQAYKTAEKQVKVDEEEKEEELLNTAKNLNGDKKNKNKF